MPMLFGELLTEIVQGDEPVEQALDREARTIIRESRARHYLPVLHQLQALDLADRPYAQVLVGLLGYSSLPRDLDLTDSMLDAALDTFVERHETEGEALVWWVRGNVLLGVGDVAGAARAWQSSASIDPSSDLVEDLAVASLAYGSFCVDGDVEAALVLAESAVTSARHRNHGRGEGLGLVYSAFLHIHAGRFAEADAELQRADDVFGSQHEPPFEWPLAFAGHGSLAALRGQHTDADVSFLRAILMSRQMKNAWYEAIVRILRADFTMKEDSRRAHADCRYAQKVFDDLGDVWWSATARRVRADAALASGEIEAARLLAEQLLIRLDHPVERGRCLITAGRAHLEAGDTDAAIAHAEEAVRIVEPTGATFLLVQALLLVAECEPWRAPDIIDRARGLTTDDLAYAQLWATRPSLRIRVLARQSIRLGDHEVHFRTTRAEHLVLMLALTGGRGVDVEMVIEALWPDADPSKLPSNLSTATYDARQALGTEAWRLHRSGSQFWLDLDGAVVDLDDAMRRARGMWPLDDPGPTDKLEAEQARQAAIDELRVEILPTLAFEPWVREANRRRISFLELLGANSSPSDAAAVEPAPAQPNS